MPWYALGKFSEKILNIFAVNERTRNQIFFERYPKKFCIKKFSLVLLDGFLNGFSIKYYSMRMLSIRGNDFIAHWAYEEQIFAHAQPAVKCEQFLHVYPCWAYAERFSSHTEHTRMDFIAGWAYAEMFKSWISWPNRIRFSKISCYRPLGP